MESGFQILLPTSTSLFLPGGVSGSSAEEKSQRPRGREDASPDSMLELFLWLALHWFCYSDHMEWFALENPAALPDR